MATVQRQILAAVVARLRATPALIAKSAERIRIAHRSPVTREESPAIHVVPQSDELVDDKSCNRRRLRFTVAVLARDDGGIETIDELLVQVMARLKPGRGDAIPYPAGVVLKPGVIRFDEEVADADIALAEFSFEATYSTADWSLEG